METNSAFDDWYNGLVGFHINSERMLDDLGVHESDTHLLRKWMIVCWNSALDSAAQEVESNVSGDSSAISRLLTNLKRAY